MHNGANPQPRPRVTSRAEAERLLEIVLAAIAALETTLADESSHLRLGRIAAGLASGARKSELTATYLQSLEAVKANAIALARFAPEAVARLKSAHAAFGRAVEANQTVLATVRAVSESLVKGISDELNRAAQPRTYAPGGFRAPHHARSEALVVSRSL
jgi:hypothetical protein